jgi:hypothetical protein
MSAPLELVQGALALDRGAFEALLGAEGRRLATGAWVAAGAGLSTAVGQSVALFAVRVSPRRFAASLVVQMLLYVAAFFVWALSIAWVARIAFDAARPLGDVIAAIGLAYAPQLLGALGLMPYFGAPLQTLLSAWTLMATVVAASVAFGLGLPAAIACTAGGWVVAHLGQRTVGRPVVRAGRRVRSWVAGAELSRARRATR